MSDILKVAEQMNSEVTRLNNERSKLEGMLESARTNYEKAIKAYEVKYGVKLTEENLQAEYNEVFAKTKGTMMDLQEKIESIKRGDYKKDVETVEYDLEPDVEPIREKVEEKTKRSRKAKAEKVEKVEIQEPEEIVAEENVESILEVEETPKVEDGPLKLDFGFEGFGDVTAISVPEEKVEDKPIEKKAKGSKKTVDPAILSAAVKASENIKQNPVSFPEMSLEDDEVDIKGIDTSFGTKPEGVIEDAPTFGAFSFTEDSSEKKSDTDEVNDAPVFGGFGDFGGFGNISESSEKKEDIEKEVKDEAPITPEGWGSDIKIDFGNFDDILKSGDIKFGE